MNVTKYASASLAVLLTLFIISGGAVAIGAFEADSETEEFSELTLVTGESTEYKYDVDADGDYKLAFYEDDDGDLTSLYETDLVSSEIENEGEDDEQEVVEFETEDSSVLYDSDDEQQVEEGADLVVRLYDDADNEEQSVDQTIATVADGAFVVDDALVSNEEDLVSIETIDPFAFGLLGEERDAAEVEQEIIFSDDDMEEDDRTAVVQFEESEIANIASDSTEVFGIGDIRSSEADDSDVVDMQAEINGERHLVYLNEAPSDADEETVVVYDESADQIEIQTESDRQTKFVEVKANDGYGFIESFRLASDAPFIGT